MGDQNKLPRTWAGDVGVKDVVESLKMHTLAAPVYDSTARIFGNGTTAGIKFERTVVLSKIRISFHMNKTTSHLHKFRIRSFRSAQVISFTPIYNSTGALIGATTGFKTYEASFTGTQTGLRRIAPSQCVNVRVYNRTDAISRVFLQLYYFNV